MEVVEMVLTGRVNKDVVDRINRCGGRAVGLSGKDGSLLIARKMALSAADGDNDSVDLGLVGEVCQVNPQVIEALETARFIPVIAMAEVKSVLHVGRGENHGA